MSAVSLKVNDNGKVNKVSVKWKYTGVNGKGYEYPLKIWENLECVLAKHGIVLKRNEVSKEIDFFNFEGAESRNGRIADIHSLQIIEGLGMNEKQVTTAMARIAEEKSYNPFIDMLKENENSDISIIKEVFLGCLSFTIPYGILYSSETEVKNCFNLACSFFIVSSNSPNSHIT